MLQAKCELSNDKKLAAKRVSELSSELFFTIFIRVTVHLFPVLREIEQFVVMFIDNCVLMLCCLLCWADHTCLPLGIGSWSVFGTVLKVIVQVSLGW